MASVLVALVTGCSVGSSDPAAGDVSLTAGPTLANDGTDSGFRPERHGFSFPNRIPTDPFSYADAVAMFGDAAVCREGAGDCTPRPEARAWVEKLAAASWGGLCEGMAVMAADRWFDGEEPETAGLTESPPLSHRLMQWWATQFLPTVVEATTERSAVAGDLLDRLEHTIGPGGPGATVTLDHLGARHTLTPYAVRRDGSQATVLVYDPNRPGEERRIDVDLVTGEWLYDFPADPADKLPWTGNAFDVGLVPLEARAEPWSAPFLDTTAGSTVVTITTSGTWSIVRSSVDGAEMAITADNVSVGDAGVLALGSGGSLGTVTVVLDPGVGLRVESGSPAHVTVETDTGSVSARAGELAHPDTPSPSTISVDLTDGVGIVADDGAVELAAFTDAGVIRSEPGATRSLRIGVDGDTFVAGLDGTEHPLSPTDTRRTDAIVRADGTVEWSAAERLPAVVRAGTPEPDWSGAPTSSPPDDPSSSTTTPVTGPDGTGWVGPSDGSDRVTISIEFPAPGSVHIAVATLPDSPLAFVPSLKGPGVDVAGRSTMSIDRTMANLPSGGEFTLTLTFEDEVVVQRVFVIP